MLTFGTAPVQMQSLSYEQQLPSCKWTLFAVTSTDLAMPIRTFNLGSCRLDRSFSVTA